MIISKSQIQNILKAYGSQNNHKVQKKEGVKGPAKQDSISISEESRLKQQVLKAVKQEPDIRADKVEELRERIAAGTYTLEAGEVAEKMIARAIVDKLI
ncbi:anti-sigma-28 factor, FlgM family [Thermosyntropha lipolytica DSM 11003]|uniref:Negative regulator of flagellin synthesis n=1 Tax=Thermosyntropha lipolytica DSM 11003 TaxID=1123382 RepID=A0A1M5Q6M9_9FIRM|nr:flagellar biosynthesis anti-sigma factor FlgM [Thermosyntropha lipolytica]SHH09705.1 anti-sigma-28 factor, FlgM family [Thermosyntropha lipolytica DSM 11003]